MNKPVLYIESNTLCHYGIKGQRWGRRRYQNEDGTLTIAGKKRYLDTLNNPYVTSNRPSDDTYQVVNANFKNGKALDNGKTLDVTSSSNVTYKKDSNGNHVVRNAAGKNVTVSKNMVEKGVAADYADLTDEELDKLYEITGDISVLKYRNKRHQVIRQEFANVKKSKLNDFLATVANGIDNAKAWVANKIDYYRF